LQIWPVHRHFCGPGNASPFTFPPLTAVEAQDAILNLSTTYSLTIIGPLEETLEEALDAFFGRKIDKKSFPVRLFLAFDP
jgi:hypothetical protein